MALVFSLITNKCLKITAYTTILILTVGIFMIHIKDGWFVVGGGRNGVEFNFLIIFCLLNIMYPKSFFKTKDYQKYMIL